MIENISLSTTNETTICERTDTDDSERAILTVFFCNFSGASVDLTIYLKQASNAAGSNSNMILKEETIEAGKTYELDASEKIILKGHTAEASRNELSAKASTGGAIVATVSYKDL